MLRQRPVLPTTKPCASPPVVSSSQAEGLSVFGVLLLLFSCPVITHEINRAIVLIKKIRRSRRSVSRWLLALANGMLKATVADSSQHTASSLGPEAAVALTTHPQPARIASVPRAIAMRWRRCFVSHE